MADRMEFIRQAETMMALYTEGKYLQALDANEQLVREFPDEAPTTALWRVCLLSVAGRTDEALRSMSEAVGKGFWWSEQELHDEPDLAPLQGLPAFEAMVSECGVRKAAAQKASKPHMSMRLPAEQPPYPLLIALHGAGNSPEVEDPHWGLAVKMGWMLAAPQSSQLRSPGMFVWDDRTLATQEVMGEVQQLLESHPVDRERLVLAGFSQGARLAIELALRGDIRARGFLAVAPATPALDELEPLAHAAPPLRGYLLVGGRDPRHEAFPELQALLNRESIACEMEDHPKIGHEFPVDFEKSLDKALRFILQD